MPLDAMMQQKCSIMEDLKPVSKVCGLMVYKTSLFGTNEMVLNTIKLISANIMFIHVILNCREKLAKVRHL